MQSTEGRLGLGLGLIRVRVRLGLGLVTLGGLPVVPTKRARQVTIDKCGSGIHKQREVVITIISK